LLQVARIRNYLIANDLQQLIILKAMPLLCDNRITPAALAMVTVISFGLAGAGEVRGDDRAPPNAAHAAGVDSEHMFGFTVGSDIGSAGEIEIEAESDSGLGRRAGRYIAAMNALQLKATLTDQIRISPHIEFSHHAIAAVPGMADLARTTFAAGGVELKYRVLNRADAPFGLTLGLDASAGRLDAATGQPARDYGLHLSAALDRELIPDRLFGAINLLHAPSWLRDHATGAWTQASQSGIGAALVGRIGEGVYLGGEVRYLRAHESTGWSGFSGEAVFAGPSIFVMLTPRATMTVAWNAQIAGHAAGETGALDLKNFERHQVRVRFGFGF
jgi:hypothetical protein